MVVEDSQTCFCALRSWSSHLVKIPLTKLSPHRLSTLMVSNVTSHDSSEEAVQTSINLHVIGENNHTPLASYDGVERASYNTQQKES